MSFVLVVVYRIDPASAIIDYFFDDWADVLEPTSAFVGRLVMEHIKLHVDDITSTSTARSRSLLDSFGRRDFVG
jgi:hypothetical protein